jgi:dTDP-4-amino-4,6-dideoxygalactose transaminase
VRNGRTPHQQRFGRFESMNAEPVYISRPLLPELRDLHAALEEIFAAQWLTNMGDKHNRFERELHTVLNVPHVSLFNNGTIALMVALKALELPAGSEVITTPFTFAATPHSIRWNGLEPVFADIECDTMTIDPESIERSITKHTSAILGVHVYGYPCRINEINTLAEQYNLKVIYDAAHAFSTMIEGQGIGNFGAITMFSFHATKLFNTMEGGCLTYQDSSLLKKIYNLRNFGIQSEDIVEEVGINGKMNEIQAALGLLNLELFEEEKQRRARIKRIYDNALQAIPGIRVPQLPDTVQPSYQYYPVLIEDEFPMSRNELYQELKRYNIFSRKYFSPLCTEYICYGQDNLRNEENLSNAKRIRAQVLCLPFYGKLQDEAIKKIIAIITKKIC